MNKKSSIKHLLAKLFFLISTTLVSNTTIAINNETLVETKNLVKAGNKFVTLLGTQVKIGDKAPNFKVVDENFSPVTLDNFIQQTTLISVVPSLDTGVCSIQTKRFNDEVANLPANVAMLTISNDLPFAQKRYCKTEKVNKLIVLSDAVWRDFGSKYGLLIKDMGLLTRAIFIIDEQGNIAYKELVDNISQHPNYEQALATIKALSVADTTLVNKNKAEIKTN